MLSALFNKTGEEVLHECVPLLAHRVLCSIPVTWLVILAASELGAEAQTWPEGFCAAGKTPCAQLGLEQCWAHRAGGVCLSLPCAAERHCATSPWTLARGRTMLVSPVSQHCCEVLFRGCLHSLSKRAAAGAFLGSDWNTCCSLAQRKRLSHTALSAEHSSGTPGFPGIVCTPSSFHSSAVCLTLPFLPGLSHHCSLSSLLSPS